MSRTSPGRVGTSMVEARLRASRSRRRDLCAFCAARDSVVRLRYSTEGSADAMVAVVDGEWVCALAGTTAVPLI